MILLDREEPEFLVINDKKILISSYSFKNLPTEIINSQKNVFNHLDIPINQYVGEVRHPQFLDFIINNIEADYFIFFDVDCVPLKTKIVEYLIDEIGEETMIGIEQQSNLRNFPEHIYAGPACFAISKKFYDYIGKVSFNETHRGDVAEELTFTCEKLEIPFKVMEKTHSENNLWPLKGGRYFGHGTTYGDNLLYHQFEIRKNIGNFINKCNYIINN